MNRKRIGVVTGTRAEYGLLKPLLEKLNNDPALCLCLLVTGAHLEERLGYTCREIEEDGFSVSRRIPMHLTQDTPGVICLSLAEELKGLSEAFQSERPDLLVVLGDRYEILGAAVAAAMFRIPIAHIHGGEVTEGAIDDAMRHAVTKLSYLHFASTPEYAKRIIQMGEQPGRVFHVGALGVEAVKKRPLLTREELAARFTRLFCRPYLMVTYHPVTLDKTDVEGQMEALFAALLEYPAYNCIFTYANADSGGAKINRMIDDFVSRHEHAAVFKSMGQIGYLSALKYTGAVVGNSSSGIIEAPSLHVPTVDIGDRQKGRIAGGSVLHCGAACGEIKEALGRALTEEFRETCRRAENPYEGGDTSGRIAAEIKRALENGICLRKKFYEDGVWK